MTLTFYTAPMSTASVTEAVLAELGVPHECVVLDITAGETRTADFLKLNPNGRVPTIVHDDVVIWESAAITLYLGETFGTQAGLYPPPGPRRGEAMTWVVWANTNLAEPAGRLFLSAPPEQGGVQPGSQDWVAPEEHRAGAADKARADIAAHLRILDGALAGRDFLLGDYSLADTHLWVFVFWLAMMDVDLTAHPNVAAWKDRVAARRALAEMMPG